jgi:hypothetical protein
MRPADPSDAQTSPHLEVWHNADDGLLARQPNRNNTENDLAGQRAIKIANDLARLHQAQPCCCR